jgi:hypothetical protein
MATKKTSKGGGKSGSKAGSKGASKKGASKKSAGKAAVKSGGKKSAGKHVSVAARAAALAAQMVASNANIEAFKRVVVRNRSVQDRLASAASEKDFVKTAVQVAGEHGLPFSESAAREHLKRLQQVHPAFAATASEVDPGGGGGGGGGGGSSSGCSSSGTVSNPAYSIQCGLNTQKCLCTI